MISIPIWLVIAVFIPFFYKRIKASWRVCAYLSSALLLLIVLAVLSGTGKSYIESSMVEGLVISIAMFFVAYCLRNEVDRRALRTILLSYVISTIFVSVVIYLQYFIGGIDFDSRVFVYKSKNSFAQLVFVAIVILLHCNFSSKLFRILAKVAVALEFAFLIILRCRTVIAQAIVLFAYMMFSKWTDKRVRGFVVVGALALCGLLIAKPELLDILEGYLLLTQKGGAEIDVVFSGRVEILSSFSELFAGHTLTGIGATYFECFPLSVILQFGVVLGGAFLLISYYPIGLALATDKRSVENRIFFFVAIGFLINSFLEGLCPLGPGAKCYILWMLLGFLSDREWARAAEPAEGAQ